MSSIAPFLQFFEVAIRPYYSSIKGFGYNDHFSEKLSFFSTTNRSPQSIQTNMPPKKKTVAPKKAESESKVQEEPTKSGGKEEEEEETTGK